MDTLTQAFSSIHWETLVSLMLGISLSAAAGFRVFVPLLIVSGAAILGHIDLPSDFDWAETNQALLILAVASLIEVIGYYIPFIDALLDTIATPAAIVAGTLMTAAAASDLNPALQWTLAIVAGGGTAGLTKGMANVVRAISIAVTAGLTNPIVATIELVLAVGLTLLAITVPLFTGLLVIVGLILTARRIRKFFKQEQPPASSPDTVMQ
ncbi:MAG: DUF4126 domain-containing protein [Elainellaceae cyanobacterium]